MSSTVPRPLRISVSTLITSRMSDMSPNCSRSLTESSSLRSAKYLASYSTDAPVTSLRPMRRLNFIRPTPDRS